MSAAPRYSPALQGAIEQRAALGMVIKPIGDVPAHGHNSVVAVAFHIIDREADKFGRETTTAKRWLGVSVVERDLVAVNRVVEHRNDVARYPQDVPPRVWLMG